MQRRIIAVTWWLFALAVLCFPIGIVAQRVASHTYVTPLVLIPD